MTTRHLSGNGAPPTLSELQARMQAAILDGGNDILSDLSDGAHAPRDTLFGVYRHAYKARLVEVLANEYPLLRSWVGEDAFGKFARAFLTAHPSQTQNARWVGKSFPEFLKQHWLARARADLSELAAIERGVSDAFDSADAPVLGFADLSAFEPSAWGQLTFSLHPSVTLLYGETNALQIWKALKDDAAAPPAERRGELEHSVVWRHGTVPKVRAISYEEAMMCREASHGVEFGAMCALLATYDDPDNAPLRAAQYLQGWVAGEMLTSAQLGNTSRGKSSQCPAT
jgi:hypothetical protein